MEPNQQPQPQPQPQPKDSWMSSISSRIWGSLSPSPPPTQQGPHGTRDRTFSNGSTTTEETNLVAPSSSNPTTTTLDISPFEEISHSEASLTSAGGWTLHTDRLICYLWFFTPLSFNAMASLLNYATSHTELKGWLGADELKEHLAKLMDPKSLDEHAFVYHEVQRISQQTDVDWSPPVLTLNDKFAAAWKLMQKAVTKAGKAGQSKKWSIVRSDGRVHQGIGLDALSDKQCVKAGINRTWSVEARRELEELSWPGLGALKKGARDSMFT